MRLLCVGAFFCAGCIPVIGAQDDRATCDRAFDRPFASGGRLSIDVRSGDIEVVGANREAVRVTCELKDGDPHEVNIRFRRDGSFGDLSIHGGPNNDVRLRIEVPKQSGLTLRTPAGDLNVSGIAGDKDISMHAGDLTISVGNPRDYRSAEASVFAGDLAASAFGVTKDGLFRSFSLTNTDGKYKLRAHVGAGDLVLQ